MKPKFRYTSDTRNESYLLVLERWDDRDNDYISFGFFQVNKDSPDLLLDLQNFITSLNAKYADPVIQTTYGRTSDKSKPYLTESLKNK